MVYHKWPFTSFAFSVTSNWALHVLYMEKKRGTSRGLTKQIFKYQMTFWLTRECYYLIHRVHRLMYRKKMFYNFALKNKTTDAISYWLVFIQHMNQTTWVLALISLYESLGLIKKIILERKTTESPIWKWTNITFTITASMWTYTLWLLPSFEKVGTLRLNSLQLF